MKIAIESTDGLNGLLKMQLEKQDYYEKVQKVLKDYRRKAAIPGFRPGNVPMGLIEKKYGKALLFEELNKLIPEKLYGYLSENKIQYLGEPIPVTNINEKIDLDRVDGFEFCFEIGMVPNFEVKFNNEIQIPYYQIIADDNLVNEEIKHLTNKMGKLNDVEEIEDAEILMGDLTELDENGQVRENGIKVEDSFISLKVFKDDEIKKKFKGLKKDNEIVFNLRKALPNDSELAHLCKIEKEAAANLNSDFNFKIKQIQRFFEAEINQDFYDGVFGKDVVKTEEEFKQKIVESLEMQLNNYSVKQFIADLENYYLENYPFDLPDAFLKKWIKLQKEKDKKQDQLENEPIDDVYENSKNIYRWQIIKDKIKLNLDIKVTEEEVKQFAVDSTTMQFIQYGFGEEYLKGELFDRMVDHKLKDETQYMQIFHVIGDNKLVNLAKEKLTLNTKKVTVDEFKKLSKTEEVDIEETIVEQ